ncbi:MAG: cell division protease FtsH [Cryomorphaceae bacterium]|jgi:cell division protease FtsH
MANQRPPEPPPKPKGQGPMGPDGKPVKSGTNWRVIFLLLIGVGIIFMAYNFNNDSDKAKEIGVAEFVTLLENEKILIDPLEGYEGDIKDATKLNEYFISSKLKPTDYLTHVKTESAFQSKFVGKRDVTNYADTAQEPKDVPFAVFLNTQANSEFINSVQTDYDVAMEQVSELPLKGGVTEFITIKRLQHLLKEGNIVLKGNNRMTLQKLVAGSSAVFEGDMIVTPLLTNESPEWKPFTCAVNYNVLSDHDRNVIFKTKFKEQINSGTMKMLLWNLLPILLIVFLLFFLFRSQMKNAGKGAMSFGKSKAKMLNQDSNKVTFKDVAGIQEAKEELFEIVDFLRDPKKFEMLGGNIPKGVLMIGSPGTGKTLLARAIAGEAEVPFFSISGSDFVEMFVGVGASRVRDMFEQGKKNSPCIIFIDEIDAVGRHRGQGMGGGNDEREQTLNALLVEMDGFDARSGVIIIAATNRPDVLDPALLRPGRFDRQVRVNLPDVIGREQILAVHAKKVKLNKDVDLAIIARGTPGFSGAELANLLNEAALLAARTSKKDIKQPELEEARDKVRWGRERRSLALSDKEKENTAYHEAGHAILNIICEHTDPLHKVTIIPRGPALGVTMFLPEEDKFTHRRAELVDQLCVAMGGRVAEELKFGNVTNGASGDIRQATSIARKMVCEWGMSDKLGMVEYGGDESGGEMFMAGKGKTYSEETAQLIDEEIRELIESAYNRAKSLLIEHRDGLNLISEALLEYETLNGEQTEELLYKGEMSNPPHMPTPPDPPTPTPPDPVKSGETLASEKDDDPLDGEVVGAPA